jgi:hypothetical protein
MNMQKRSDERSMALHREIAKKLGSNPDLWAIPKNNIARWKKAGKRPAPYVVEWEYILCEYSRERILSILESDSEESARLRSSSPFTGILNDDERRAIFDLYSDYRRFRVKEAELE